MPLGERTLRHPFLWRTEVVSERGKAERALVRPNEVDDCLLVGGFVSDRNPFAPKSK